MKKLTPQHGIDALWEIVPVAWIPAIVGICHWLVESGYASSAFEAINGQREATMLSSFLLARVYSKWKATDDSSHSILDRELVPNSRLHNAIVDLSPVLAGKLGVSSDVVVDLLLGLPKLLSSGQSGSNESDRNQRGS